MWGFWGSLGNGIVFAFVTWLLQEFGTKAMVEHLWSLFTHLLPFWIGLIGFTVWWIIQDYVGMRRRISKLEEEPANRSAADNQLGNRINTVENLVREAHQKVINLEQHKAS